MAPEGGVEAVLGQEGKLLLADVRVSVLAMPPARRSRRLRIFQLLPKSRTDSADYPRIGHPGQANARMLPGTVPVEEGGPAYFRAPARKPLYFQAVDEAGRAVQGMAASSTSSRASGGAASPATSRPARRRRGAGSRPVGACRRPSAPAPTAAGRSATSA